MDNKQHAQQTPAVRPCPRRRRRRFSDDVEDGTLPGGGSGSTIQGEDPLRPREIHTKLAQIAGLGTELSVESPSPTPHATSIAAPLGRSIDPDGRRQKRTKTGHSNSPDIYRRSPLTGGTQNRTGIIMTHYEVEQILVGTVESLDSTEFKVLAFLSDEQNDNLLFDLHADYPTQLSRLGQLTPSTVLGRALQELSLPSGTPLACRSTARRGDKSKVLPDLVRIIDTQDIVTIIRYILHIAVRYINTSHCEEDIVKLAFTPIPPGVIVQPFQLHVDWGSSNEVVLPLEPALPLAAPPGSTDPPDVPLPEPASPQGETEAPPGSTDPLRTVWPVKIGSLPPQKPNHISQKSLTCGTLQDHRCFTEVILDVTALSDQEQAPSPYPAAGPAPDPESSQDLAPRTPAILVHKLPRDPGALAPEDSTQHLRVTPQAPAAATPPVSSKASLAPPPMPHPGPTTIDLTGDSDTDSGVTPAGPGNSNNSGYTATSDNNEGNILLNDMLPSLVSRFEEDWEQACQFFCHNPKHIRHKDAKVLLGARPNQTIRFYQAVAIFLYLQRTCLSKEPDIHPLAGLILAFSPGTGKTRIALGIIAVARLCELNYKHVLEHPEMHREEQPGCCSCEDAWAIKCSKTSALTLAVAKTQRSAPAIVMAPAGLVKQWEEAANEFYLPDITVKFPDSLAKYLPGGLFQDFPFIQVITGSAYKKEPALYKRRLVAKEPGCKLDIPLADALQSLGLGTGLSKNTRAANTLASESTAPKKRVDAVRRYLESRNAQKGFVRLLAQHRGAEYPEEDRWNSRKLVVVWSKDGTAVGNLLKSDLMATEVGLNYTRVPDGMSINGLPETCLIFSWLAPTYWILDESHEVDNKETNLFQFAATLQRCSPDGMKMMRSLFISGTPFKSKLDSILDTLWKYVRHIDDASGSISAEVLDAASTLVKSSAKLDTSQHEALSQIVALELKDRVLRLDDGFEFHGVKVGYGGRTTCRLHIIQSPAYKSAAFQARRAVQLKTAEEQLRRQGITLNRKGPGNKDTTSRVFNIMSAPIILESFPGLASLPDKDWAEARAGLTAESIKTRCQTPEERLRDGWLAKFWRVATRDCPKLDCLLDELAAVSRDRTPLPADALPAGAVLKKHVVVYSGRPRTATIIARWLDEYASEDWQVVYIGSRLTAEKRDEFIKSILTDIPVDDATRKPTVIVTTTGVCGTGVDTLSPACSIVMFDVAPGGHTITQVKARIGRASQRYEEVFFTQILAEGLSEEMLHRRHNSANDMLAALYQQMGDDIDRSDQSVVEDRSDLEEAWWI